MSITLLTLLLQFVAAGFTQAGPIIVAIKGLIQSHPTMTPEQKAALLAIIDQDVVATTNKTDADLDAIDVTKPPVPFLAANAAAK